MPQLLLASFNCEARQLQKRKKVALALSGGGFKAQATFAGGKSDCLPIDFTMQGFIPALVNAKDSTTKDLLSTLALKQDVMGRISVLGGEVDAITCASSGCWYTSQLIYSQLFLNMSLGPGGMPHGACCEGTVCHMQFKHDPSEDGNHGPEPKRSGRRLCEAVDQALPSRL